MRALKLIAVLAMVAGCATDIMQGYVGKPIVEAELDYGRPSNIIELEDGRRAYQWNVDAGGIMPMTNYNSGTVYGGGGFANYSGTSTTYVPYENNCIYTLFATKQGSTWVVTGFREPSLSCM